MDNDKIVEEIVDAEFKELIALLKEHPASWTIMLSVVQCDIKKLKELLGASFEDKLRESKLDADLINEVASYNISDHLTKSNLEKVYALYNTMSRQFRYVESLLPS